MKFEQDSLGSVSEQRRKIMQSIHNKDTGIEIRLRKALWSRGIRYRKNLKSLPGTPDIAITKYRIAIFCDSEFFHGKDWESLEKRLKKGKNPEFWTEKIYNNMRRDFRNNVELRGRGWTVIHFWGKDIINHLDKCIDSVEEAIVDTKLGAYDQT